MPELELLDKACGILEQAIQGRESWPTSSSGAGHLQVVAATSLLWDSNPSDLALLEQAWSCQLS